MRKILIVDESATRRHQIRLAATRAGAAFIFDFDTGSDAISVLSALCPAVLVVGHELQDMTGLVFVRQVRSQPEMVNSTLILLSSNSDVDGLDQALKSGADDFIVLPVDVKHLENKIRSACLLEGARCRE